MQYAIILVIVNVFIPFDAYSAKYLTHHLLNKYYTVQYNMTATLPILIEFLFFNSLLRCNSYFSFNLLSSDETNGEVAYLPYL